MTPLLDLLSAVWLAVLLLGGGLAALAVRLPPGGAPAPAPPGGLARRGGGDRAGGRRPHALARRIGAAVLAVPAASDPAGRAHELPQPRRPGAAAALAGHRPALPADRALDAGPGRAAPAPAERE